MTKTAAPTPAGPPQPSRFPFRRFEIDENITAVRVGVPGAIFLKRKEDSVPHTSANASGSAGTTVLITGSSEDIVDNIQVVTQDRAAAQANAPSTEKLLSLNWNTSPRSRIKSGALLVQVEFAEQSDGGAGNLSFVSAAGSGTTVVSSTLNLKQDRNGLLELAHSGSGELLVHCDKGVRASAIKVAQSGSGDLNILTDLDADHASFKSTGSGSVTVRALNTAVFEANSTGSGSAIFDKVQSKTMTQLQLHGSGDIYINSGKTPANTASVHGSGDIYTGAFEASVSNARVFGSGSVEINAQETLMGDIAGSGTVRYTGNPASNRLQKAEPTSHPTTNPPAWLPIPPEEPAPFGGANGCTIM